MLSSHATVNAYINFNMKVNPISLKSTLVGTILVFSLGLLYTHSTGKLYPGAIFMAVLPLLFLILHVYSRNKTPTVKENYIYVIIILLMGAFYRAYIFYFPESLIGVDTFSYAITTQEVIASGSTSSINQFFYSDASSYYVIYSLFALISGMEVSESMIIFPIILGIIIPISSMILTRAFGSSGLPQNWILAGSFATIVTMSVHHAYSPNVQSLAVSMVAIYTVALLAYFRTKTLNSLIVLFFLLFSMIFTHKLVFPIVVLLMFSCFILSSIFDKKILTEDRARANSFGYLTIMISSLLFMYIQWGFITDYFTAVQFKILSLSDTLGPSSSSVKVSPSLANPSAAVEPHSGIGGILMRNGYGLVLLPMSGIAWIHLLWKQSTKTVNIVVLSFATSVIFVPIFIADSSVGHPARPIFFAEFVLVTICAIVYGNKLDSNSILAVLKLFTLVMIATALIFSTPALPDHPGGPRFYITSEESAAKEFGHNYINGSVHVDPYYSGIKIDPIVNSKLNSSKRQYKSMNRDLIDRKLPERSYPYVGFRNEVDIYRVPRSGVWRLTWDPQKYLEATHNQIYDNSGASLYNNPKNN